MQQGHTFPPPTTGDTEGGGDTFASITVTGLTALRLVATDALKALASVATLSSWVAGTANRVTVSDDGDGTITLSAPQDIATTSSPTFVGATLTGLTATRLLQTDGSKVLTSVADLTTWIAGTANQITVTSDGDGSVTLSTPQSIGTGSSPTFAGVTVSGLTASRIVQTDGAKALASIATLSSWVAGTTNQISVADDGDGSITLSTPQNIHTTASPSFTALTLTGNLSTSATGRLIVGAGSGSAAIRVDTAAASYVELAFTTASTLGGFQIGNDSSRFMTMFCSGSTAASTRLGITAANAGTIEYTGVGEMAIGSNGASPLYFSTNNITRVKILSTAEAIFGDTYTSTGVNYQIQIQKTATSAGLYVSSSLTTGLATLGVGNNGGKTFDLIIEGSTSAGTRFGLTAASIVAFQTNTINALVMGTTSAFPVYVGTNNTVKLTIDSAGNTVQGTAALATTATDGFIYSAGCAGVPTGVPTTYTGRSPIVVDTTNSKLYFYSGGAWKALDPGAVASGWTDDGVVVRLTTSTDAVSIGSATENAKLYLLGDDATQTTLRVDMTAGAGATIKIVDLRGNSGGTPALTYDNAGNLRLFVAQADANPGVLVTSAGFSIGAGGASAVDTRLLRAAANVWQIDNAAGGAAFLSWAATSTPTAAGRLGISLVTGRTQAFVDGQNRQAAGSHETLFGPRIIRTMVYNAGSQTVAVYGMSGQTTTGSQANIHTTLYGEYLRYASAGALNDDAGWSPDAYDHTRRRYDPIWENGYLAPSTITDIRVMCGMFSADPMGSATPAVHGAWFRYDTVADATAFWRFCTDDGGGAPTVTTTGVAFTTLVGYRQKIVMDSAAAVVRGYLDDVLVATHSTDLPSIDQDLAHQEETRALVAAARHHHTQKMVYSAWAGPQ